MPRLRARTNHNLLLDICMSDDKKGGRSQRARRVPVRHADYVDSSALLSRHIPSIEADEFFSSPGIHDRTIMNSPQNATLMVDSVGGLYPEGSLSGLLRTDRVSREVLETVLATCSAQINVFSAVMEEFFAFVARESPDVLLALESEDLGRDDFWQGMCDTVCAVMSKVRSDQKTTYENNPLRTSLAAYCHKLPAPPPSTSPRLASDTSY